MQQTLPTKGAVRSAAGAPHLRDACGCGSKTAALNKERAAHPASTPLPHLLHVAADGSGQSDWHGDDMEACPWLAEKR